MANVATSEPSLASATCLLCGSNSDDVVLRDNGYLGRRCECGIVYTDPRPGPAVVETIRDFHPDSYYEDPASVRFGFVNKVARDHLSTRQPLRLLEVGAGHGHVVSLARQAGYEVAAIEPNPTSAAELRALGVPTEEALLADAALDGQLFDVVFHIDLLSHFVDPVAALTSMRKLATDDGLICFEVGVFGGLKRPWYRWIGKAGYPQHLWFFSHNNLAQIFADAGLEVVERQDHSLWIGTFVSTVGNRVFRWLRPATTSSTDAAPRTSGMMRAYGRAQHHLRYTIGSHLPAFGGPQCSFYALRATGAS